MSNISNAPARDKPANDEMVRGYIDGLDIDSPEPGLNQSLSYKHGFRNGRDDRGMGPCAPHSCATAQELRDAADWAMEQDEKITRGAA